MLTDSWENEIVEGDDSEEISSDAYLGEGEPPLDPGTSEDEGFGIEN